jgi:hypothetical protein
MKFNAKFSLAQTIANTYEINCIHKAGHAPHEGSARPAL